METYTFTPTFASALRENVIVFVGMAVLGPLILLGRSWAHRGMTIVYMVTSGLVGGILGFLYYTVRFFLRVPRKVIVSESELLLHWRNGTETRVPWDEIQRAVFRVRWGYRWKFFLGDSAPILFGDGFSAVTWERITDSVVAQLRARNVPIEAYDLSGKRVP